MSSITLLLSLCIPFAAGFNVHGWTRCARGPNLAPCTTLCRAPWCGPGSCFNGICQNFCYRKPDGTPCGDGQGTCKNEGPCEPLSSPTPIEEGPEPANDYQDSFLKGEPEQSLDGRINFPKDTVELVPGVDDQKRPPYLGDPEQSLDGRINFPQDTGFGGQWFFPGDRNDIVI